jgi:hypothetical protein
MMKNNENKIDYDVRGKFINNNLFNFHVGKAGVLYHPKFFSKTKDIIFKRKIYTECCETGDDIWFNFMRIANGSAEATSINSSPGTGSMAESRAGYQKKGGSVKRKKK